MSNEERVYIGCPCGADDCHDRAAGHRWCPDCERHVRLMELTDDGECPRHATQRQAQAPGLRAFEDELHALAAGAGRCPDYGEATESCDCIVCRTRTLLTEWEDHPLLAALTQQGDEQKGGVGLIAAERERQIAAEGWTPEHDDQHDEGDLARAAACYLDPRQFVYSARAVAPPEWPWSRDDWKPACSSGGPEHLGEVTAADYIRNLVKAGALIAAEIDRLLRTQQSKENQSS